MTTRTDLGKIFITNGGEYDPTVTYEEKTFVLYKNSTYLALQTVTGIEPTDDRINWQLMARGFNARELSDVTANDTSGAIGNAGATVSAQSLVDWIADQVMTKVLKKTELVNNALANTPGIAALDAAMGKNFQGQIDAVNSNLDLAFIGRPTFSGNVDELSGANAGSYWVNLSNLSGTIPTNIGYGILEVTGYMPNTTCLHKLYVYSQSGVSSFYIRMFTNSQWYPWREYKDTASGLDTKAPKIHAASSTTYGGGTSASYGHVKLSDNYTSSAGDAAHSIGASSTAVANAYANSFIRHSAYTGNIDLLKTATSNGTYWIDLSNVTGTKPANSGFGVLEVINGGSNTIQKLYMHGDSNESIDYIAYRLYANNRWYPWRIQYMA